MAAQAKGKISERRDRRTAHCDYREHLKSLGGEGGAGNWSRRPQWDMGGGSSRQRNIHGAGFRPSAVRATGGQAGKRSDVTARILSLTPSLLPAAT